MTNPTVEMRYHKRFNILYLKNQSGTTKWLPLIIYGLAHYSMQALLS